MGQDVHNEGTDAKSPSKQSEAKPPDSRAAILAATEALLLESGYEGFSIRKLVERCGFTAPTIYHHFGDKSGLLDELLEVRLEIVVTEIRTVPLVEDPVENLRRLFRAWAEYGIRNPTHYRLLTASRAEQTDAIPAAQELRAILLSPLENLAAQQRLHGDDLEETRQMIWSFLHGLISLQRARPDEPWTPNLLEIAIDAMLRGCIRPKPERASSKEDQ